jgi:hypothetical protein
MNTVEQTSNLVEKVDLLVNKQHRTACVAFYTDDRYDELAHSAKSSFLAHNGDECDYIEVNYNNKLQFEEAFQYFDPGTDAGIMRDIYAYEIMRRYDYEKVIIVGCDTITCARLDEFLDDNTTPVLATLNYYIQESTEYWQSPIVEIAHPDGSKQIDHLNINSDVVCFNSHEALLKVIQLSIEHYGTYTNQGGLNELAWSDKSYEVKIVDAPYPLSKVSYNVRSKGVPRTNMIKQGRLVNCFSDAYHGLPHLWLQQNGLVDGDLSPIHRWYVEDGKIFTHDHKQIKCFHFVEGIGGRPIEQFTELINDFKYNWFNKDTVKFFKEVCNCNVFFKDSFAS